MHFKVRILKSNRLKYARWSTIKAQAIIIIIKCTAVKSHRQCHCKGRPGEPGRFDVTFAGVDQMRLYCFIMNKRKANRASPRRTFSIFEINTSRYIAPLRAIFSSEIKCTAIVDSRRNCEISRSGCF